VSVLHYDQPLYRPPSEADSLIIQAVIGCPHNACTFCDMYKSKTFRARPQREILADLETGRRLYGEGVRSLFLADGNAIVLSSRRLEEICRRAGELFPRLDRITTYGSAKYVMAKTLPELRRLREVGLSRMHMGLESGDPVTLRDIAKGATVEQIVEAGRRVVAAGMELSLYIMVGVAGTERWREHALGSAAVVSQVEPRFVRLRTFVPRRDTELFDRWRRGGLILPDPYQALAEVRLLVEKITGRTELLSDHMSNFLDVRGRFPEDRQSMLGFIDTASRWPRDRFRPDTAEWIDLGL